MTPILVTYDLKTESDYLGSSHQAFYSAALTYGWLKHIAVKESTPYKLPNTTFMLFSGSLSDSHAQFAAVLKLAERIRGGSITVSRYVMMPVVEGFPVYENLSERIAEIGPSIRGGAIR